jgi:hypothetical protein
MIAIAFAIMMYKCSFTSSAFTNGFDAPDVPIDDVLCPRCAEGFPFGDIAVETRQYTRQIERGYNP